MRLVVRAAVAALLLLLPLPLALSAAPAVAATAVDTSDPARFVTTLTDAAFGALRSGGKAAARAQFRTLLADYFAVDQVGERLIRRWNGKITPAQRAAYKAALPGFVIGTYADRLAAYKSSTIKVVRTMPSASGAQVVTSVTRPGGGTPLNATWVLEKSGGGYKVANLIVGGINVTLTQGADFDAVIQRQGFDSLLAMMKARG